MKFGHQYREYLEQGGFPAQWIDSAISYGKLKKCIKRVKQELTSLGLDVATLQSLLESVDRSSSIGSNESNVESGSMAIVEDDKPLRYEFTNRGLSATNEQQASKHAPIRPMLLFLVDEETGEPLDARLAPETKNYIHQVALSNQLTNVRITDIEDYESSTTTESRRSSDAGRTGRSSRRASRAHRLIEVPLSTDSEFFDLLQSELSGLATLQAEEKEKLNAEIISVGRALVKATDTSDKKGKEDLARWRKLFELYVDSRVFFATNERDHGLQSFASAQKRYMMFLEKAQKQELMTKFKKSESANALQHFLAINTELLLNLKFQEINHTAMNKILKKFDKRTALGVKGTFPALLPPSLLSSDIAKALSAQVTANILSVVPSLDDFLCPVCSELAWRPVRLRCQHIYCIRCLIRLQREGKDQCPLCRQDVVLEASSLNLDPALLGFLQKYFPDEVRAKQRINERLALVEQFGEEAANAKCVTM